MWTAECLCSLHTFCYWLDVAVILAVWSSSNIFAIVSLSFFRSTLFSNFCHFLEVCQMHITCSTQSYAAVQSCLTGSSTVYKSIGNYCRQWSLTVVPLFGILHVIRPNFSNGYHAIWQHNTFLANDFVIQKTILLKLDIHLKSNGEFI